MRWVLNDVRQKGTEVNVRDLYLDFVLSFISVNC